MYSARLLQNKGVVNMNNLNETILELLSKILSLEMSHFYNASESPHMNKLLKDLRERTADFPVIALQDDTPFYLLNENQKDIDLKNAARAKNEYVLSIISNSIDDLIDIEDKLQGKCNVPQSLSDVSNDAFLLSAKLSLVTEHEIQRESNSEYGLYQSMIHIIVTDIVLPKNVTNPIKIELDNNIQHQIMKQLSLLDEVAIQIENEISDILKSESLSAFKTTEEKIINLSGALKSHYDDLQQKHADVAAQISDMYTFDNLCQEKITIEDHGFKYCYETMAEQNCDIRRATEIYKEKKDKERAEKEEAEKQSEIRKQKREKRLSRLKRIFSTPGDKIMNHYTDAIVLDIQKNYADKLGIPVYGGSTLGAMNIKRYRVEIPDGVKNDLRPCIGVNTSCQFTFDNQKYTNINKDGQSLEYSYSVSSLPIEYSCEIEILGTDSIEANKIKNDLFAIYESEQIISVPDLMCSDELNLLKLKIDMDEIAKGISSDDESQNDIYIPFVSQYYVYHTYDVDKCELTDNHELQLNLVKQAEYCEICSGKMSIAINKLENDYKNLITPPTGFLSKTFRGTFHSEDFKRLQQMFDYHQQIDKNLFHSVLKDITDVYPLWDKMCRGWSIEQIKTDMEKYLTYFQERAQKLRALLGIPATYENYKQPDSPVCTYIINYMSKSSTCLIDDAISAYLEYLQKQQEQRDEEARRRAEEARQRRLEREESGYYDQPSGGGFLSSMLSTAGGVALGNKITENSRKKERKKELQWHYTCSISCPYRGKDYGPTRCRKDPSTCGHGLKY